MSKLLQLKLLEAISIKDTIITIDAMGCQTAIVEKIIKKQADYILAVKRNQEQLYPDIQKKFRFGEQIQPG